MQPLKTYNVWNLFHILYTSCDCYSNIEYCRKFEQFIFLSSVLSVHCKGHLKFPLQSFKERHMHRYNSEQRTLENRSVLLSDFINLTQVHNFTVCAQDIITFRRLSVFTVSFTRILQVLMQIMKRFAMYYWLFKWFWYRVYNQKFLSSSPRKFFFFFCILPHYLIRLTSLL